MIDLVENLEVHCVEELEVSLNSRSGSRVAVGKVKGLERLRSSIRSTRLPGPGTPRRGGRIRPLGSSGCVVGRVISRTNVRSKTCPGRLQP